MMDDKESIKRISKRAVCDGHMLIGPEFDYVEASCALFTVTQSKGNVAIGIIAAMMDDIMKGCAAIVRIDRKDATDFARRILAACEESSTGE